jgi:hypothetical protein
MLKTRRRVTIGITAAATIASTALLASPVAAAPLPWPTAGRVPIGCTYNGAALAPNIAYFITDPGQPSIPAVHIGSTSSNITVLPPAGAAINVQATAVEKCSGVSSVTLWLSHNGAFNGSGSLLAPASDAFSGTWSQNLPVLQGSAAGVTRPDAGVGYYQVILGSSGRRYDSFQLDANYKITGSPTAASATVYNAASWSLTKFYALRATTLSNALSATRLKKGKTVKATAQLKMATNAGYVADAGAKVYVQTKVGTGKWVTNAALTTNASGVVSYSFVLAATTQVRFIHNKVLSGKFTNTAVSAIKVVTKI